MDVTPKFALSVSARHTSQFLSWNVFLLLKLHISEKASKTNLIPVIMHYPRTFSSYLFSGNSVYLCLTQAFLFIFNKKKSTHKKMCFNMKYLKLMTKHFKKLFYISNNCYSSYWIYTSITKKPNPLKQHLFTRFWLDKSQICNKTLHIIQLFKNSPSSKENLKILKIENM